MRRDRGVTFRSLPEQTRDQPPFNLALFAFSPVTDDKLETGKCYEAPSEAVEGDARANRPAYRWHCV